MKKIKIRTIEIEDVFLDGMIRKNEEDFEIKDKKIENPLRKRAFLIILAAGFFSFFFLSAYSFKLSIIDHQKYNQEWVNNRFVDKKIKAERGIIYDRNKKPLVENIDSFSLCANTAKIDGKTLSVISKILGISQKEIEKKINSKKNNQEKIILKKNLKREEIILLETKKNELNGIEIKKATKRRYLGGIEFSQIIGYLGKISKKEIEKKEGYKANDFIGKTGIEKEYENYLVEKKGIIEIERDAKGNIIAEKTKELPRSGNDLVLTIDYGLEKKSAEALNEFLSKGIGTGGVVIAIDPRNGDILSLVSSPSFDNNLFSKGISPDELKKINSQKGKPQFNRAISGLYPTGSVIKPLISIAALEEKIVNENTKIFCPLKLCLENKYSKNLECFADWKFHGWTDVKKAIAGSVNPFYYMVGGGYVRPKEADKRLPKRFKGLGPEKIKEWLEKFNWGKKTLIDLPGEKTGRIPSPEWKKNHFKSPIAKIWHTGDTYNLSIGQGYIMITPIEVAAAFQAIANDGTIYQPRVVKEIISGKKEKEIKPNVLNSGFFNNYFGKIVKEGMRMAVVSEEGTAPLLRNLPVAAAAKTGTAQTPRKDTYHNWIVAFAPYDKPKIVLVVLVENVKGEHIIAQKVAQEILSWYFSKNN